MKVLISGVTGFIGQHAAARFLRRGDKVVGFDNLSRLGSSENLAWLRGLEGSFEFAHVDVRDGMGVGNLVQQHQDADAVLHLAAQVAVTTSVHDPHLDFHVNALGTFNLLEACRRHCPTACFLYASTNKVYGETNNVVIEERATRYAYANGFAGVTEDTPLDFHSPYACSKGSADQYVRDYARIYGMPTVVLRQSCIYGTRQLGVEDQGWVAWFTIATRLGKPITIYGDGKQVRDLLWVEDLIDLYELVVQRAPDVAGSVFNVGGGPENTLSVVELVDALRSVSGRAVDPRFDEWRPGDQRIFVASIDEVGEALGWNPRTSPRAGIESLYDWTGEAQPLLETLFGPAA